MTNRHLNVPRTAGYLLLACASFVLVGCGQTVNKFSNDPRPMPPKPTAGVAAPPGAKANAVAIQVAPKPRDTNGNGYPDLIELAGYLFSKPHDMPIYEDGSWVFTLYLDGQSDAPGATPICEWRIEGEELEKCKVGRTLIGLTYSFQLSLLDTSGDTFPLMPVDLVCRFEPADGRAPIQRREVHKMQIGFGRGG